MKDPILSTLIGRTFGGNFRVKVNFSLSLSTQSSIPVHLTLEPPQASGPPLSNIIITQHPNHRPNIHLHSHCAYMKTQQDKLLENKFAS